MRKFLIIANIISLAVYFSGCSTVLNTTTQEIGLNTIPPNARVTVDGKKFGATPQQVNVDRGVNHVIKFELEGNEMITEPQLIRAPKSLFIVVSVHIVNPLLISRQ